jgi:surface antigen
MNSDLVAGMIVRVAVIFGLVAVAGCTTVGLPGAKTGTGVAQRTDNGRVAATIINAMGGGLVGGQIGEGLSDRDRRSALEAEYRALEYTQGGRPVGWKSSRSDRYGEVVAAQPYRVGSQDCRQYTHTIFMGGQSRSARGTACRNPDGSWTPLT